MFSDLWCITPAWLDIHGRALLKAYSDPSQLAAARRPPAPSQTTAKTTDHIAIIRLHGPMVKRAGFFADLFGFVGTENIETMVKQAAADSDIEVIVIHAESPGGHVSGVHELSETIRAAANVKPVFVHADDLMASAAIWATAHATTITAGPTTEIGSVGTLAMIADTSKAFEKEGVRIHLVSTGKFKGLGAPGQFVDDEELAEVRKRVETTNDFFLSALKIGRNLSPQQLEAVSDGRVFGAAEARALGLVDTVQSFETTLSQAAAIVAGNQRARARRRIDLARG